jgi:ribonucleotide monophosphatase NagD (HAD superfamily)
MSDLGVSAEETLVVGDRLDTDIEAGIRAGCAVQLVLTGVESEAPDGVPFSQDVAALVDKLL